MVIIGLNLFLVSKLLLMFTQSLLLCIELHESSFKIILLAIVQFVSLLGATEGGLRSDRATLLWEEALVVDVSNAFESYA
jgi:hypothetical protein